MKVFISWSGDISKAIATALRDWLPKVIQSVKPWMSEQDIPKGTRWLHHISEQLEQVKVGIICLTPDNPSNSWILFEAGALAKTLEDTYVCPYLFRLFPSSVEWPLAQFQLSQADKDDTRKLVATINTAVGESQLSERHLDEAFEKWWPDLEKTLSGIPQKTTHSKQRSDREILEEVLNIVRQLSRDTPSTLQTSLFTAFARSALESPTPTSEEVTPEQEALRNKFWDKAREEFRQNLLKLAEAERSSRHKKN